VCVWDRNALGHAFKPLTIEASHQGVCNLAAANLLRELLGGHGDADEHGHPDVDRTGYREQRRCRHTLPDRMPIAPSATIASASRDLCQAGQHSPCSHAWVPGSVPNGSTTW
jgi:hypothetical protein